MPMQTTAIDQHNATLSTSEHEVHLRYKLLQQSHKIHLFALEWLSTANSNNKTVSTRTGKSVTFCRMLHGYPKVRVGDLYDKRRRSHPKTMGNEKRENILPILTSCLIGKVPPIIMASTSRRRRRRLTFLFSFPICLQVTRGNPGEHPCRQ